MNGNRVLALFDFDGTLTHPGADSLLEFILFAKKRRVLALKIPAFVFALCIRAFRGKLNRDTAKEALLAVLWKGERRENMEALGRSFAEAHLPRLLRPDTLALLREQRDAGAHVAVVSASLDLWLRPFCAREGVDCLCTELHFENGRFTGRFATPNCNRAEKARRIRAAYHLDDYERIEAYGNSPGDAAMFGLATRAWYCWRDGSVRLVEKG